MASLWVEKEEVDDLEADSEDEVFFGPVSKHEAKLIAKYARRKTEVFYTGFRDNMSMIDTTLDEPEQEDDGIDIEEESLCQRFACLEVVSATDDDVGGVDRKHKIEMLNDSLDVHRRRSMQTIDTDVPLDEYVPETSIEEDDDSPHEDSMLDPIARVGKVEETCSEDYFTVPLQSSGSGSSISADLIDSPPARYIVPAVEDKTPPTQCYETGEQFFPDESHFVTAIEFLETSNVLDISVSVSLSTQGTTNEADDIKITCCLPSDSLSTPALFDVRQVEDFSGMGREQNDVSGIQSLGSTCAFEDSLEKSPAEEESKLDEGGAPSTFRTQQDADISELESNQSSPLEENPNVSDEIKNVSCQTSFAFAAMTVPARPAGSLPKGKKLQPGARMQTRSKFVAKGSHLPVAVRKASDNLGRKGAIRPNVEISSNNSRLPTFKTTPSVSTGKAAMKKPTKDKFEHIRSPIAAYIRDNPSQPLIQNIKPRAWRAINCASPSSTKPAVNVKTGCIKKRSQYAQAKGNILKENHDNFVPPPAIVLEGVIDSEQKPPTHHTDNKDDENKDPFKQPLPFVINKGSKAMVQKEWDQTTKLHTTINLSTKLPSPHTPIVIKHTGQHKKIQWADHLVTKLSNTFSPSRPTGIAPPILVKGIDFDNSDADGPNAIEVSIVEVVNAKRVNTLFK